jgi:transcriptional antiterminator NusG
MLYGFAVRVVFYPDIIAIGDSSFLEETLILDFNMQWYVLRVATNREMYVKETLERKVEAEGIKDIIGRIEVPFERIKRIRGNKQAVYKKKLYPGYVFMEMQPDNDGKVPERAWFVIKETSGVGDFIGTEGIPTPMRDTESAKVLLEAEKTEESPSIKVEFAKGDRIKIREGAFENFEGVVDSIDPERGIVKVIVTIFGRSTPLDIEYWQIEKL